MSTASSLLVEDSLVPVFYREWRPVPDGDRAPALIFSVRVRKGRAKFVVPTAVLAACGTRNLDRESALKAFDDRRSDIQAAASRLFALTNGFLGTYVIRHSDMPSA